MRPDEIVYSFPTLDDAATACRSSYGAMRSQLDTLQSHIEGKLLQTWDGRARDAYWPRQAEWNSAATDLGDLLNRIAARLDQACVEMQATEGSCAAKFE